MAQQQLAIIPGHNQAGYLSNPPEKYYAEFKSLIDGLNTSRIAHALRENPGVCLDLVQTFWNNASINPNGDGGCRNDRVQSAESASNHIRDNNTRGPVIWRSTESSSSLPQTRN